jgi:hypothetical protein
MRTPSPKHGSKTAVALLLAFAALFCAAPGASAETITSTYGALTAELTYTPDPGTSLFVLQRLKATLGGVVAYDGAIDGAVCGGVCYLAGDPADASSLRTLELDGDTGAEVLASAYSGGAHCCSYAYVLDYSPVTGAFTPLVKEFDAGFVISDSESDNVWEIDSRDARFDYRFTAHVFSGMPIQRFRLTGGTFAEVTRSYPSAIAKDARDWLSEIRKFTRHGRLKRDMDVRGFYAARAADLFRLGSGATAVRELNRAARRGLLEGDRTLGRRGRAYVRDLLNFLRRTGYR